ncbi:putative ribonuclease H-like domain-containing protein [Tanacetum coccineum]
MVRSMWLFKHKFHADGTLSRYKARLVANGSSQQLGVDVDVDVDVDETFSYATWAKFYHSRCDSSLFIYRQSSQVAYLLLYVDDIILTASSTTLLQHLIDSLHHEFDMTDLGTLNYFLGISVVRHSTGLFLSQQKYALQLLERAHMVNCNPSRTPVDTEFKLGPDGVPVQDPTLYRSLTGGLQYLTFTRSDLSYAVQQIYLNMHDSREPHLAALKRLPQSQEKDTVIKKLKERINALSGKTNEDKIKQELEEINIELDHREEATVLRDLVEHVQSKYPLDQSLESACRYIWRPTGRTFTIVGNACPLTRITTTTEVPLRKSTALDNETSKPVVTLVYSRKPRKSKTNVPVSKSTVLKSVSANRGRVGGGIMYMISRVYDEEVTWTTTYPSVGQFYDSNLEVAFRQHTCFIHNLEGVDLLTGSRGKNLYTLSLGDMMAFSPICLLSKASKTKSWLWHRCLSHMNFGVINQLSSNTDTVRGLPKLKSEKNHLCYACAMGKSKKKPHKPKSKDTNQEKLYLLHMDLCGPMRVASVNGKKYILVIVDDYSRFTWVKFLRSKDEAPYFIIKFLKMIQVRLQVTVRRIRTDNGTEFVNQTLREYYEKIGISHETYVARSPQQNGVVERRNHTLIEAARTMLIYAKAPLFLWAEAVATACYTQNRSIIRLRHDKTPYELLHDKPPDLSFFHVFGALCYPTNDSENLGKLQPKADIDFDELTTMASEHNSSGPALHEMTPATISSGLVPNPPPSTPFVPPSRTDWDILFQPMFDELLTPPPSVDLPAPEVIAQIDEVVAPVPAVSTGSPSSTTVDQDAPSPSNSQTTPETQPPVIPNDVEEDNHDIEVAHMGNDPYFGIPIPEVPSDQSSSTDSIHTIVHPDHQISEHNSKWTKDHPLENIIGELDRPVSTRLQLHEQALFCYYDAFLTAVEPKTYKDALTQSCWIEAMQEELNEFERLEVWELVPRPDKVMVITLKWIYKVKLDELGGILKNKARLVARGYRQEEGIDFEERMLPVAR